MNSRSTFSRVLATALLLPLLVAACGDDDDGPTGNTPTAVGVWNTTSFQALGSNFIQLGMGLQVTLNSNGTYSFAITNDLIGFCEDEPDESNCTKTGNYSTTSTTITIDPGTEDAQTFNLTVTSSSMQWSGNISGNVVTAQFTRATG